MRRGCCYVNFPRDAKERQASGCRCAQWSHTHREEVHRAITAINEAPLSSALPHAKVLWAQRLDDVRNVLVFMPFVMSIGLVAAVANSISVCTCGPFDVLCAL